MWPRKEIENIRGELFLVAVCALASTLTAAQLSNAFSDGMVLQRGVPLEFWGSGAPGEHVTVSLAGCSSSCEVGADCRWRVVLPELSASSEEHRLVVRGTNEVSCSGVLVGEVWMMSGQSNAALPIWGENPHFRDAYGGVKSMLTRKPLIRFCNPSVGFHSKPQRDFHSRTRWLELTPENVAREPLTWPACGYYAALELHSALDVPIGMIVASCGATPIEAWIPLEGWASRHEDEFSVYRQWRMREPAEWSSSNVYESITSAQCQPCGFWNGKLEPWGHYAIKGVFWYQGCHNAAHPRLYCEKMHALYDGWKRKFGNPNLRFYFAQLAPYGEEIAVLQEEQERFAREEPNSGISIINDLGNPVDVHPNQKYGVALRLVAHALRRDYGFLNVKDNSPSLKSWKIENGRFVLMFNDVEQWAMYHPDWSVDSGFEVAGDNGLFVKAQIENLVVGERRFYESCGLVRGRDLVVVAKGVHQPRHLRYLHSRNGYGALLNEVGLPLGAFHIDVED